MSNDNLREAGEIYNQLSFDNRRLLNACLMENELRLIKRNQEIIMEMANKACAEQQARFRTIKGILDKLLIEIKRDSV